MKPTDVTVSVVSFNTRNYLERCLESLFREAGSVSLQTIVVDNASTDGSADMILQRFPQAVLIRNSENRYFSKANNQAFNQAPSCNYFLLLNPDTELHAGALQIMVDYLEQHPNVGIAGPRLLNSDGSWQRSFYRNSGWLWGFFEVSLLNGLFPRNPILRHHYYQDRKFDLSTPEIVDTVTAACMLVRADLMKELGGMDEGYTLFGEEIDLCRRARKKGYATAYLPAAHALHHIGRSTGQLAEKRIHEIGMQSLLYYYKKFYSMPTYLFFRAISFAAQKMFFLKKGYFQLNGFL